MNAHHKRKGWAHTNTLIVLSYACHKATSNVWHKRNAAILYLATNTRSA